MTVRAARIVVLLTLLILLASGGFAIRKSLGQVRSETPKSVSFWGGVVPHYAAVMPEIERFWEESASERPNPSMIILIGPDHQDAGLGRVTTTTNSELFQGRVTLALQEIRQIASRGFVTLDDRVFVGEHAIQLHIPSLNRKFANIPLLPLLIRSGTTLEEMQQLARELRALVGSDALVVASVDFSHYVSVEEARRYDEESLDAMRRFDYQRLSEFGPEHMDSDQSIVLLSELVCPSRDCGWEVKFRQNSGEIAHQNPFFTTTAMSLVLQ